MNCHFWPKRKRRYCFAQAWPALQDLNCPDKAVKFARSAPQLLVSLSSFTSPPSIARMKSLLLLVGVFALAAGLLFAGQGMGLIRWPQESFMVGAPQWIYYGGGIALAGAVLIALSRR